MGLNTTHGCWDGPYSAFHRWRQAIAKAADIPLLLMEGFHEDDHVGGGVFVQAMEWAAPREGGPRCGSYNGPVLHGWIERIKEWLPISWDRFSDDPLSVLLRHSDCDGAIAAADCEPIADRLVDLMVARKIPREWIEKTVTFAVGLRTAVVAGEDVEFH